MPHQEKVGAVELNWGGKEGLWKLLWGGGLVTEKKREKVKVYLANFTRNTLPPKPLIGKRRGVEYPKFSETVEHRA